MNLIRKERTRLRREYLAKEMRRGRRIELVRTREYTKAVLPLLPWFVAVSVEARPSLQLALLVLGALLTLLWLGFVSWTLLAVEARLRDRQHMLVDRYELPEEYHR